MADTTNTYETGYSRRHPVTVEVRADNLETIAGYPNEARIDAELAYAAQNYRDSEDNLRWLVALAAAKLEYINAR